MQFVLDRPFMKRKVPEYLQRIVMLWKDIVCLNMLNVGD